MRSTLMLAFILASVAQSNADSGVGPIGIDSTGLQLPNSNPLNGAGIGIGQVEGGRPGKPITNGGPDDATNSAPTIVPAQVYMGASVATPANGVTVRILTEVHAEPVASVMISTNGSAPGVAPNALLHASGHASLGFGQRNVALTANFIANRNGGDISAINLSIGLPLDGGESIDGGSHLSSFVDWSAFHHDVLYVVAGREEEGGTGPVPSDNYNGITVAASENIGSFMDVFDNTWSQNKV